jgi:NDP-sugar pyrophosphorylase family protein
MAVRLHEWQNSFGVVQTNGIDITGYEEKPVSTSYINAGVYVVNPTALSLMTSSGPYDMPMLFESIQKREGRVIAYPVHEQWLDVGRPEDFSKANTEA